MKRDDIFDTTATGHEPWAVQLRPWNPLHDDGQAAKLSRYLGHVDGQLAPVLEPEGACHPEEKLLHEQFKAQVSARDFPCVAARSAINRKTYRFGVYDRLGTPEAALALCHDLYEFSHEWALQEGRFTSFIASFKQPIDASETKFETLMWQQLQLMHGVDSRYFEWDASVSRDPDDPNFSFSIGGRAYFVVGLHPSASRLARVATTPCIVFNPHDQFEHLKTTGQYTKLQTAIRERDVAFQGSINPVLANFGHQAESRQYSGRAVGQQWKCPFQHQTDA